VVPGDVSSQFLSALLLIAPATRAGLNVKVVGELKSVPYVEMTRHVMGAFGVDVHGTAVAPQTYRAGPFAVEPDASSACYFMAAAAITGGRVQISGLGSGSWQGDLGFVDVLDRMGCGIEDTPTSVTVVGPEHLSAVDVDLSDISDQAPTFAAVAAYAEGTSRAIGIGFIRRKESNRIAAVVEGLKNLGIEAHDEADGFSVVGGRPRAGVVATHDDHRIAMSFGVMGLRTPGVVIEDPGCTAKTFPGFFRALDQLRSGE
jgi:3-phosphoshikimate 1-carboxyvinyltransferase